LIRGFVHIAGTDRVLFGKVERTETFLERTRGLLGRSGLAPGEGMLITPCNSIHTIMMRFALDIAFLDQQGVILKLVHTLAPWRFCGCRRASSVLELPVGALGVSGLHIGDQLIWEPIK
jgi:uncharacterized membrane protein (UPF0127 family)